MKARISVLTIGVDVLETAMRFFRDGLGLARAVRDARVEDRQHRRTPPRRIPAGQIEHQAREEAGLEHAKQEAQRMELPHAVDGDHRDRHRAPQHQDPRERAARAVPAQQRIARHLEQHVADEEQHRAEAVHRVRQAEILPHLQLREADVAAVEDRHDVADEQERHDPRADAAVQRGGGRRIIARAGAGGDAARRLRSKRSRHRLSP
ncbi:hypothetical protein WL16_29135 [Burkholderia ubonensis]|nr:hypothetical protein WL16_29135 [Burkholderia ubonensis]